MNDYAACPVVFDVDALCTLTGPVNWHDPGSVLANTRIAPWTVPRIQSMRRSGWSPFFVSNRSGVLGAATFQQILAAYGATVARAADILTVDIDSVSYHRTEFEQACMEQKVEFLDLARGDAATVVFVADRLSDLAAAAAANTRFLWVHEWRDQRSPWKAPYGRHLVHQGPQPPADHAPEQPSDP